MLKLLIADATEEFRIALAERLAGSYVIRCCNHGKQTMELIHTFRPDMLVLDMMLPALDGISLLKDLRRRGKCLSCWPPPECLPIIWWMR